MGPSYQPREEACNLGVAQGWLLHACCLAKTAQDAWKEMNVFGNPSSMLLERNDCVWKPFTHALGKK